MTVYVNTFFEKRLRDLFDLANRVEQAFSAAGLDYRIIGGLATYLYVEEAEPDAGRLTRDIDIVVRRIDLDAIAKAVEPFGLRHRHVAGVDMLVQEGQPSARRAVHMVSVPELGSSRELQGVRLIPLANLVRMKLASFLLKDQLHIKDMDEAHLLTSVRAQR